MAHESHDRLAEMTDEGVEIEQIVEEMVVAAGADPAAVAVAATVRCYQPQLRQGGQQFIDEEVPCPAMVAEAVDEDHRLRAPLAPFDPVYGKAAYVQAVVFRLQRPGTLRIGISAKSPPSASHAYTATRPTLPLMTEMTICAVSG